MSPEIIIQLEQANVSTFAADVLVLKYARAHYGVDRLVAQELGKEGVAASRLSPAVGQYELLNNFSALCFKKILYIGVNDLATFGYANIREFAAQSLCILGEAYPNARHVCMTIHGVGSGLDENEALLAQLAGLMDSLRRGQYPAELQRLSIVELNAGRVQRLQGVLTSFLTSQHARPMTGGRAFAVEPDRLEAQPAVSARLAKRHIFVAMPFAAEMNDTFHYGIQAPIHHHDFLCERLDHSVFTGDILARMKTKIATASAVVADLTLQNPNVYLEVGYAWGLQRPTILLARQGDELKFDVQGQRCLRYTSIRQLETLLTKEIDGLVNSREIR